MQDGKCYSHEGCKKVTSVKLFGICTLAWVEPADSETVHGGLELRRKYPNTNSVAWCVEFWIGTRPKSQL